MGDLRFLIYFLILIMLKFNQKISSHQQEVVFNIIFTPLMGFFFIFWGVNKKCSLFL